MVHKLQGEKLDWWEGFGKHLEAFGIDHAQAFKGLSSLLITVFIM